MASYSRRKNKAILLHGKELKLAEPKGRLSLAYRGIEEVPIDVFVRPSFVKILDLSFNKIVDFSFLQILTELNTLVLDNNRVNSHTVFPPLLKLEVLWINGNEVSNLALFIGNITSNFPNIKYLSMMKNAAAPSYFNGGSKQEYQDYRYYVISQIPKLHALDDTTITEQERVNAVRMYGPRRRSNSSSNLKSNGRQWNRLLQLRQTLLVQ